MARKQNKAGTFSEYQWEIINHVKSHQGMRYADMTREKGWPSSTISGTIRRYERETGERIGIVGSKPRTDHQGPSITQQRIIQYLQDHPKATITECADKLQTSTSYVSMTVKAYLPARAKTRPQHYKPRLPDGRQVVTIIKCIQCNRPFPSPDKVNIRRCNNCKKNEVFFMEEYSVRL